MITKSGRKYITTYCPLGLVGIDLGCVKNKSILTSPEIINIMVVWRHAFGSKYKIQKELNKNSYKKGGGIKIYYDIWTPTGSGLGSRF